MDRKQKEGVTRRVKEVDDFLLVARRVWTGRLVSNSYGLYGEKSICMETDLKNRVLDVVENYSKELKERLKKEN